MGEKIISHKLYTQESLKKLVRCKQKKKPVVNEAKYLGIDAKFKRKDDIKKIRKTGNVSIENSTV